MYFDIGLWQNSFRLHKKSLWNVLYIAHIFNNPPSHQPLLGKSFHSSQIVCPRTSKIRTPASTQVIHPQSSSVSSIPCLLSIFESMFHSRALGHHLMCSQKKPAHSFHFHGPFSIYLLFRNFFKRTPRIAVCWTKRFSSLRFQRTKERMKKKNEMLITNFEVKFKYKRRLWTDVLLINKPSKYEDASSRHDKMSTKKVHFKLYLSFRLAH